MLTIWNYNYALFIIGLIGLIVLKKNILILFFSLEILLLSINLNLIFISLLNFNLKGQLLTVLILTLAAAEAALGLAILISFYKNKGLISLNSTNLLKN